MLGSATSVIDGGGNVTGCCSRAAVNDRWVSTNYMPPSFNATPLSRGADAGFLKRGVCQHRSKRKGRGGGGNFGTNGSRRNDPHLFSL